MSLDYYLVVPAERWPSSEQLQEALSNDATNITIDLSADAVPDPLGFNDETLSFNSQGTPVTVYCSLYKLTAEDFHAVAPLTGEPAHEVIEIVASAAKKTAEGDIILHLQEGPTPFAWGSAILVFTTFVRHFDGMFVDPMDGTIYCAQNIDEIVDMAKSFTVPEANGTNALGTTAPLQQSAPVPNIHTIQPNLADKPAQTPDPSTSPLKSWALPLILLTIMIAILVSQALAGP